MSRACLKALAAAAVLCVLNVCYVAARCSDFNGVCLNQNRPAQCRNGVWLSGHCPGASNIKCCAPTPACNAERGVCLNTASDKCSGTLLTGKCPGPSSIRCCVPNAPLCDAKQGRCINTNRESCSGNILSGLCPGPANIRCCASPSAIPRSEDYAALWASMNITKPSRISSAANTISRNRARYENVSSSTSVPWQVIGVIHMLEASANFRTHLHNGDPLSNRTVHVPANRPPTGSPPFTWEESAADALGLATRHIWRSHSGWDIASTLWKLEAYNGFGYKAHDINSPYLWAGTNHYASGKFVADGKWSSTAVSAQAGAAGVLKELGYTGQ